MFSQELVENKNAGALAGAVRFGGSPLVSQNDGFHIVALDVSNDLSLDCLRIGYTGVELIVLRGTLPVRKKVQHGIVGKYPVVSQIAREYFLPLRNDLLYVANQILVHEIDWKNTDSRSPVQREIETILTQGH